MTPLHTESFVLRRPSEELSFRPIDYSTRAAPSFMMNGPTMSLIGAPDIEEASATMEHIRPIVEPR